MDQLRPLKIDIEEQGGGTVVRLHGSAGISESEKLRATIEELVSRKCELIVLDLSDMDFICSSALGTIITAQIRSRHHKGEIRLVDPQPPVRELLEITRLTKLFTIHRSIADALAR